MSLKIIKPGILDTIQDTGRYGNQLLGINPGGAMDKYAVRVANALVQNNSCEAVIEMHFPAPVILFEEQTLFALTGADFGATLNGEIIPVNHPVIASKNSILQFQRLNNGSRCYLSVYGGFELNAWLNSFSTNLKARAGGYDGRSLDEEDVINCKRKFSFTNVFKQKGFHIMSWSADNYLQTGGNNFIRVLPGNEWNLLSIDEQERFTSGEFIITSSSDRMAFRTKGPALNDSVRPEMLSSAVNFGTIQLLPDGQLIILMADHQTTGGYPRIAHVISADHSRLAQKNAGQTLKFQFTDQKTAEELLLQQELHLHQLENACTFKLEEALRG